MKKLLKNFLVRFGRETAGQDLIEYALMAGFVVVLAGALMPGIYSTLQKVECSIKGGRWDAPSVRRGVVGACFMPNLPPTKEAK